MREAIAASEPLARLGARLRESSARFDCARDALPGALRPHVAAGPIDDEEWCLLVPHSAAAAKIRQLLPALRTALEAAGHPRRDIRIRVHQDAAGR